MSCPSPPRRCAHVSWVLSLSVRDCGRTRGLRKASTDHARRPGPVSLRTVACRLSSLLSVRYSRLWTQFVGSPPWWKFWKKQTQWMTWVHGIVVRCCAVLHGVVRCCAVLCSELQRCAVAVRLHPHKAAQDKYQVLLGELSGPLAIGTLLLMRHVAALTPTPTAPQKSRTDLSVLDRLPIPLHERQGHVLARYSPPDAESDSQWNAPLS